MLFLWERANKIADELKRNIYTNRGALNEIAWKAKRFNAPQEADADETPWQSWNSDQHWGGRDTHAWFRFVVETPACAVGRPLALLLSTDAQGWDAVNPQFLVFLDGQAVQGVDGNHRDVLLTESAEAGRRYRVDLQAYGGRQEKSTSLKVEWVVISREVESLYYDIIVPLKAVSRFDDDDQRRVDTVGAINDAVNLVDLRDVTSPAFQESVIQARKELAQRFYQGQCRPGDITATCVGHTHIDVAWLWTLAQTREKTARSFSTVLKLMDEYPEYVFMSSQAQLYEFLKEDHPEVYERVKQRVAEGRWEVEGGMWLEADCNVTSGESLVRQFLFGTRFFKSEFGVDTKVLWLPDVFGYSAALPQIMQKSGIEYFMTTKIAWNQFNKIPYDTFNWRGIDGTEILTHFITTRDYEKQPTGHFTTYNGKLTPLQVMGAWQRYQQKNLNKDVLICFGYGDGGGGANREMLEEGRRMTQGIPGCPQVKFGKALDYFKRLAALVGQNKRLPKWVGELYLEYHRGTYTSMARNKRYNRRSELLYQEAEFVSTLATVVGCSYPQQKINRNWKTLLKNQFHDILPGSSIKEVYEDSQREYQAILADGQEILEQGMRAVTAQIGVDRPGVVVWNTLSFPRNDYVICDLPAGLEHPAVVSDSGATVPCQRIVVDGEEKGLIFADNVPAKGYKVFRWVEADSNKTAPLTVTPELLENAAFRIELDKTGAFTSIYDKRAAREVLPHGARANVLQAFEDKPMRWDNWDIDIYYQEKMWEINELDSIEVKEAGPERGCLEIRRPFSRSQLVQRIYIYANLARIDVETQVDWREDQVLLKVAFPVDVHSDKATFDIQFGNVERPTHWNTSWDWARFEVCAHKWMDLSEAGYGVSVLNDSKYGCDVKDHTIRLTLLKSGMHPNAKADREKHRFTYSLYPHEGDWRAAQVVQMGYQLNVPLRGQSVGVQKGEWPQAFSLLSVDADNIVVETVKKAEDSEDWIIRFYEAHNKRTTATLRFGVPIAQVTECDLMERDMAAIACDGQTCSIETKPYEIKTLKVKPA